MAGDEMGVDWGEVAFRDMQVSAANSARQNAEQHIASLRLRTRNFLYLKKRPGRGAGEIRTAAFIVLSMACRLSP
jgi:hypothetical protein